MDEICEAARGWVDTPAPQDTLVPAKVFTAPNGVYGNCMETSVDVQSYHQLASCLGAVVAADTGGSTAPGRALGEDAAAPAVPHRPLLRPPVPWGACCSWGWLRALLHGGSGCLDQATAPVGPWPWLSQMGFIEDTCLAWSLFSFPFEERRSHGRGVTERLSRLSWTRTVVPNELLLRFPLRLWRLQPKGQEAVEKELQPVCQRCRIHPGWERV